MPHRSTVAYFSMEVGLEPSMPTYAGGLGILAGDTLRAGADDGMPMVGITLLYRKGYFHQRLDAEGNQTEKPVFWEPADFLEPLEERFTVRIEERDVVVRPWRYRIRGISGAEVAVYFLDTALPENSEQDQALTDYLYTGSEHDRFCQETLLGYGGIALLRALGHDRIETYHMNEGHAALITLALFEEEVQKGQDPTMEVTRDAVRQRCTFTTHTPIPAGHDKFPLELVERVLGPLRSKLLNLTHCCLDGRLNMTYLALLFSRYINGVALRHGQVSQAIFPDYPVNAITNGVHASTWTSPPFQHLFDHHMPEWRRDNLYLRYAVDIPLEQIQEAHQQAKQTLFSEIASRTGQELDSDVLTIGFARRATAYKRADLLFADLERLHHMARSIGPIQILYGGKAHPRDEGGKAMIRRVVQAAKTLADVIPVIYLEDYDMQLAALLCSGVDLWLNTPHKPREASGTSGMKAALNGVPSLSILDGWWIEGHIEGVTGWAIGDHQQIDENSRYESDSLYTKLEKLILPLFYGQPLEFAEVMRSAIALNGSFFNAQRMLHQYLKNAYRHLSIAQE